jgi:hypothetical protein
MILVIVAVLVIGVTILFTLSIRAKDVPPPDPISPTAHLDDRKAAIYENLRDLQFEYRVGKLSDEDYQQTKAALQKELAVVVAETTRILGGAPPVAKAAAADAPPVATSPDSGSTCPHCNANFSKPMKFAENAESRCHDERPRMHTNEHE